MPIKRAIGTSPVRAAAAAAAAPKSAPKATRKPETDAVRKARSDVSDAAVKFETARQAMADAGEAMNAGITGPEGSALGVAFRTARDAYGAAGAVLGRMQQALADALGVTK